MNLTFAASVGAQAEQWFRDTLASSTIDFDAAITATVTVVVVAEPSAPGHNDFMCTSADGDDYLIEIRRGADDPASPLLANIPGPARLFFMECVAHELAHILIFENVATDEARDSVSGLFVRTAPTGSIGATGAPSDWASGEWEDQIQEAVAETVKDAALPDQRVYDNRTHWRVSQDSYPTLMAAVLGGGGAGFTEDFASDPTAGWTDLLGSHPGVVQAGALYAASVPIGLGGIADWHGFVVDGAIGAPRTLSALAARGPHPVTIRRRLEGDESPLSGTFKIIRDRGGTLTDIATGIVATDSGGVADLVLELDIVNGDILRLQFTDIPEFDAIGNVDLLVPTLDTAFSYLIPSVVGGRMGYKAVLAPTVGDGTIASLLMVDPTTFSQGVSLAVTPTDVVLVIAGPSTTTDTTPHAIDFAAGGTWWFTLQLSGSDAIATISTSPSGTDFSHTLTGPPPTAVLRPVFTGSGIGHYPGAEIPDEDTHYDDWFATGGGAEAPDWPYVPPFVGAAAGAPAATRLSR